MKFLILAGLLLLTSCAATLPEPFPWNASRMKPPVKYRVLWGHVENCAGRVGPFQRTEWFIIPDSVKVMLRGSEKIAIAEQPGPHNDWRPRIYIKAEYIDHSGVVAHESLHIILGPGQGHPVPPFKKCAPLTI